MPPWLLLALAIVCEVTGTSFLKASDGFSRLVPSVIVLVSYTSAFYFLSLALRSVPVGIAYAVWSGAGIALIALIGWLFLGQRLDATALLGMGLIAGGVAVVSLSSSRVAS